MPRRPRTAAAGLLIFALAATLAGCSDTTRIPDPTPEATADPLFASDEEALAAAVEVYEEFLAVSDQILQEGGEQPERLEPLVSAELYESELTGFQNFASSGARLVGSSTITVSELQQRAPGAEPGTEEVIAYFCVSSEETDVVDASGASIREPGAPVEYAFEVVTAFAPDSAVIESNQLFDGLQSCGD